jgi:hypothetical protein
MLIVMIGSVGVIGTGDMATADDILKLEAAIASGAKIVEYESGNERRKVEYRSQTDMERALGVLKAKIAPVSRIAYTEHSRD